jgi:uncharacterized protein YjbJ (UPF0337 family)
MLILFSRPGVGRVSLQLPVDPQARVESSQQSKEPADLVDRFQGKWQQYVGIAGIAWGKLTEEQLLKSQGHKDKLSALIQRRYVMSPPEADAQVERLMQKCGF